MSDRKVSTINTVQAGNEGNAPSFVQALLFNVMGVVSVLGLTLIVLLLWQGIQTSKNTHRQNAYHALDKAKDRLRILLLAAEMTAESAERAARGAQLSSENLRSVLEQSLAAFEQRPELSYLGIVLPDSGEYTNLERKSNGDILLWTLPGARKIDPIARNFLLTENGFALNLEKETDGYDARKRPFYLAAVDAPVEGVWMSAYPWVIDFDSHREKSLWGLSYVKPLRSPQGELLGVLDADLDLPALNRFLQSLEAEYNARFQVVELSESPQIIAGAGVEQAPIPTTQSIQAAVHHTDGIYEDWRMDNFQQEWLVSQRLSLPGGGVWVIVASLKAPFIEAGLRDYLLLTVFIAILLALSLMLILRRIAARFGMPLHELEERVLDLLQYDALLPDNNKQHSIVDSFRETHLLGRAVDRMSVVIKDVMETKEKESASLALKGAIFDSSTTAIFSLNEALQILEWNTACEHLFGLSRDEVLQKNIDSIIISANEPLLWPDVVKTPGNTTYTLMGEHGPFVAEVRVAQFMRHEHQMYTLFIDDVSERNEVEEQFRYLASHDGLTGLANRYLIRDRIEQAIVLARRTRHHVAVLYLDLDRFKVINDGFGHHFGDAALKATAERLCSLVRESDTVSRQGGDEFLVLLTELQHPEEAYRIAEKICRALNTPLIIEERKIHLTGSVGVSVFPTDGDSADLLIENADMAMYQAKDTGRNTVEYFTHSMSEATLYNIEIENRLRAALEANELSVVYQPKYDIQSGNIHGCEALVRWHDSKLGEISPMTFIPVAEDSGLIEPLGEWVLTEACRQAQHWCKSGLFPFRVSVNVSAVQLLRLDMVSLTLNVLEKTGLSPQHLELELTESILADDVSKVSEILSQLRASGVALSIDDFGTGYSSLNYLKRFPINTLKIDRSFIRDMLIDSEDAAIVDAVIALGHHLGFEVLAEGVESQEQFEILSKNACDHVQGFLFSKPLSPDDFEITLKNHFEKNDSDEFA